MGTLASGTATFIELFANGDDVWVVDADGVVHLALDGTRKQQFDAPRPLQAAAFNGMYLVVTDGAKLTTLRAEDLGTVADGNLVEACASAVLLSGNRLVCGPANDWDRIFYTYDALTATRLATSATYTYNGTPMTAVPGMDAFVTVTTNLSPSDFHLYVLGTDHVATYVGESPYHGDFSATTVFAFDGDVPEHLVNSDGLMLRFAADCGNGSPASSSCFTKDGALGTLPMGQRYVAMDNVGTTLTGVISPASTSYYPPTSTSDAGYVLQSVDVPARTILAEQTFSIPQGSIVGMKALPEARTVLLALDTRTGYPSPNMPVTGGYEVRSVSY